jgi:xylulokinase
MLENNLQCYSAACPDTYVCVAFNFTGGCLLRWVRDELGEAERAEARHTGRDVYDLLTDQMADKPTDLFVLPHMMATGTPHMDPDPVGAVVGLSMSTTRGQLLRAVLEGVSYEMKLNLDALERAGARLDRFRAIGGAARNDFWLQLKADMYARPVEKLAVSEAAALGMAISAGVAAGIFDDAAETAEGLVEPLTTFEPDPERARYYDERLEEYREIYPALKSWREATGYRD